MPRDPLEPEKCARLLAALAAPERLKIVRLLTSGPHNVTQIAEAVGVKPLNITHHLAVMKHAALIQSERQGRFVVYSLSPGVLETAILRTPELPPAPFQFGIGSRRR